MEGVRVQEESGGNEAVKEGAEASEGKKAEDDTAKKGKRMTRAKRHHK